MKIMKKLLALSIAYIISLSAWAAPPTIAVTNNTDTNIYIHFYVPFVDDCYTSSVIGQNQPLTIDRTIKPCLLNNIYGSVVDASNNRILIPTLPYDGPWVANSVYALRVCGSYEQGYYYVDAPNTCDDTASTQPKK